MLRHVPHAHKPSIELTSRHLLRRTRDLENVGAFISEVRMGAHVIHGLSHGYSRFQCKEEREAVLRVASAKEILLELPEELPQNELSLSLV